jgi:hypothetical protein
MNMSMTDSSNNMKMSGSDEINKSSDASTGAGTGTGTGSGSKDRDRDRDRDQVDQMDDETNDVTEQEQIQAEISAVRNGRYCTVLFIMYTFIRLMCHCIAYFCL